MVARFLSPHPNRVSCVGFCMGSSRRTLRWMVGLGSPPLSFLDRSCPSPRVHGPDRAVPPRRSPVSIPPFWPSRSFLSRLRVHPRRGFDRTPVLTPRRRGEGNRGTPGTRRGLSMENHGINPSLSPPSFPSTHESNGGEVGNPHTPTLEGTHTHTSRASLVVDRGGSEFVCHRQTRARVRTSRPKGWCTNHVHGWNPPWEAVGKRRTVRRGGRRVDEPVHGALPAGRGWKRDEPQSKTERRGGGHPQQKRSRKKKDKSTTWERKCTEWIGRTQKEQVGR